MLEAALKLAGKLAAHVWSVENKENASIAPQQLASLLHAVFPYLFELSLLRPSVGVNSKVAKAAHGLMALLATQAKLPPRHPHHQAEEGASEDEENENGFLLCALFENLPAFPAVAAGEDEEAAVSDSHIRSYNQALLSAWTSNYVTAVSASPAGAVEEAVLASLARVASSVSSASRASGKISSAHVFAQSTGLLPGSGFHDVGSVEMSPCTTSAVN